ncbi:MAG: DUF934 domain-containing protein [Proteobacteria bacterium]|nr:DUF934 domain-containing protein [Pseudomonadota bacterium]
MDNFNFSDTTVTIRDWNTFNHDGENDGIQTRILVLSADTPVNMLIGPLNKLDRIVVTSIDFNDGRIFSLGRQIRLLGYSGTLTVVGDVLPDQYLSLLSCGFDNVLTLDNITARETVNLDQALPLGKIEDFAISNPEYLVSESITGK